MPRRKRRGQRKEIGILHSLIKEHGAAWPFPKGTARDVQRLFELGKNPTPASGNTKRGEICLFPFVAGHGDGNAELRTLLSRGCRGVSWFSQAWGECLGFRGLFVKGELSPSFPE